MNDLIKGHKIASSIKYSGGKTSSCDFILPIFCYLSNISITLKHLCFSAEETNVEISDDKMSRGPTFTMGAINWRQMCLTVPAKTDSK